MKKSTKIIFITALCFLTICSIFFVSYVTFKKDIFTISFYGIDSTHQDTLETIIEEFVITNKNNAKLEFKTLDTNKTLEEQVSKNTNLIFTLHGAMDSNLIEKMIRFDDNSYNGIPQSIRRTGMSVEKDYAIPIALDHFEISYNSKILRAFNGGTPIRSFEELINFANFTKNNYPESGYPFAIAGGNDTTLLQFLSALAESFYGVEGRADLLNEINTFTGQIKENSILNEIFTVIQEWEKNGLIHPDWMNITNENIKTYIELEKPACIFMPLSFHRTIPISDIQYYTTSWLPCANNIIERSLLLPTIVGFSFNTKSISSKNKNLLDINAKNILAHLISEEVQSRISEETGLAPVHATAQALDKQASDVRLWAAASNHVLPSIKEIVFETENETKEFTEWLRKNY